MTVFDFHTAGGEALIAEFARLSCTDHLDFCSPSKLSNVRTKTSGVRHELCK